ncbi:MAG: response regulator [Gammaproteobacteria bacterium]
MATNQTLHLPKVLVVEDDKLLSHLAIPLFKEAGYAATVLLDGEKALTLWEKHPDFVAAFVDLGLPGINGFSLVSQMKALQPHIPVIVLTARMEFKAQKSSLCKQYDIEDLLIKPLMPPKIIQVLNKHVKKTSLS